MLSDDQVDAEAGAKERNGGPMGNQKGSDEAVMRHLEEVKKSNVHLRATAHDLRSSVAELRASNSHLLVIVEGLEKENKELKESRLAMLESVDMLRQSSLDIKRNIYQRERQKYVSQEPHVEQALSGKRQTAVPSGMFSRPPVSHFTISDDSRAFSPSVAPLRASPGCSASLDSSTNGHSTSLDRLKIPLRSALPAPYNRKLPSICDASSSPQPSRSPAFGLNTSHSSSPSPTPNTASIPPYPSATPDCSASPSLCLTISEDQSKAVAITPSQTTSAVNTKFPGPLTSSLPVSGDNHVPVVSKRTVLSSRQKDELMCRLLRAVRIEDVETIQSLLKLGISVSDRDHQHITPLHEAARYNSLKSLQALIEAGAPIDAGDRCDRTPLHRAACNGHVKVLRVLIASGAEIHAHDIFGNTPLHYAAKGTFQESICALLDAGASNRIRNFKGQTPVQFTKSPYVRTLLNKYHLFRTAEHLQFSYP